MWLLASVVNCTIYDIAKVLKLLSVNFHHIVLLKLAVEFDIVLLYIFSVMTYWYRKYNGNRNKLDAEKLCTAFVQY